VVLVQQVRSGSVPAEELELAVRLHAGPLQRHQN
jgi:hypothetical protein